MNAPSEKHLEDYLWAHPEALGMIGIPPEYGEDIPQYSWAFRQFRLPSGIVDLIGFDFRVCAFELKKGKLTAQSLTQLMRYMWDIRNMVDRLLMQYVTYGNPFRAWANQYLNDNHEFNLSNLVRGVLVGHGIEDDNLLVACAGCGVDVFVYEYNGVYTLESVGIDYKAISVEYYDQMVTLLNDGFANYFYENFEDDIRLANETETQRYNEKYDAIRAAEDYLKNNGGDA